MILTRKHLWWIKERSELDRIIRQIFFPWLQYVCVYVLMNVHMYVHVCMYVCMCLYVHMYALCVCLRVCVCLPVYRCHIFPFTAPEKSRDSSELEEKIWEPNQMSDYKVEQFLVVARFDANSA